MTDRELLQQMIDRMGKEPREVKLDDDDHLVALDLAWRKLTSLPPELTQLANLQELSLESVLKVM